jgi:hypothetical protein
LLKENTQNTVGYRKRWKYPNCSQYLHTRVKNAQVAQSTARVLLAALVNPVLPASSSIDDSIEFPLGCPTIGPRSLEMMRTVLSIGILLALL